jgi:hypothetical protein
MNVAFGPIPLTGQRCPNQACFFGLSGIRERPQTYGPRKTCRLLYAVRICTELPASAAAAAKIRWWMVNSASSSRSETPVLS